MSELPVVVIGAGPEGLAAAAHLLERGLEPLVLEAGDGPASAVREWGHVRLFSPWPELVDKAAARLLEPSGWAAPAEGYPTGAEWIARYLAPLAGALGGRVSYGARVTGVSRKGRDRLVDAGRDGQPFTVHVTGPGGQEERLEARAVIDASGTWRQPNPAGADGLPALGERAAAGLIRYQIPDFSGAGAVRRAGTPSCSGPGIPRRPRSSNWPGSRRPTRVRRSPGCCAAASRGPRSAAGPPTSCPSAGRSACAPGRPSRAAWPAW